MNMKRVLLTSIRFFLLSLLLVESANSAVDQLLNNNFYQNPAKLNQIKKVSLVAGNLYMKPTLNFTGTTTLGSGKATSKANNSLPYILTAYRIAERFVLGVNLTPSAYGHINWPIDSFVSQNSTRTKVFYYRAALQSSYQLTDDLSVGAGANLEYNKLDELDLVVANMGNQINKVWGKNSTFDLGVFYKINSQNYLTVAVYTPVNNKFGQGTSSLGLTTVYNYSSNIDEASVAYIGLEHFITDKLFLEEKIYWSGWSIVKNVFLVNKTNGTTITPANWRDVWSFQISSRYATTDKLAILGSAIYETNPISANTNQIGYPLAAVVGISTGLDLTLQKEFSIQLLYSYGAFTPLAKINNTSSRGTVSANFQAFTSQVTYKM